MRRFIYFILLLLLISCNVSNRKTQKTEQVTTGTAAKILPGYDAIRRTILPPLFVLLTNEE
jgi:hypothetical protein